MLTNTDLVTLHDHVNRLSIETDAKCVKALAKIRQNEKRWAPVYNTEIDTSIKLSTMKVKACEQVDDNDVTSTVNSDTKIMHQGYVYIIPPLAPVATGAPHSACANALSKHFVKVEEMSGLL